MMKKYAMIDEIKDFVSDEECFNNRDCMNCEDIESCYWKANRRCNSAFASSIGYGGYDSEDEFWENLFG